SKRDWSSDVCSSDLRYAGCGKSRVIPVQGLSNEFLRVARGYRHQIRFLLDSKIHPVMPIARVLAYCGAQPIKYALIARRAHQRSDRKSVVSDTRVDA